jgi:hypothetical protein
MAIALEEWEGAVMKSKPLLVVLVSLIAGKLAAQEPKVRPLMPKDLARYRNLNAPQRARRVV